jgi:hypothetical protein
MSALDDELRMLLVEADQEEVGVVIATNDPSRLRQYLYKYMKELDIHFTATIPREEGKLWLVRKD